METGSDQQAAEVAQSTPAAPPATEERPNDERAPRQDAPAGGPAAEGDATDPNRAKRRRRGKRGGKRHRKKPATDAGGNGNAEDAAGEGSEPATAGAASGDQAQPASRARAPRAAGARSTSQRAPRTRTTSARTAGPPPADDAAVASETKVPPPSPAGEDGVSGEGEETTESTPGAPRKRRRRGGRGRKRPSAATAEAGDAAGTEVAAQAPEKAEKASPTEKPKTAGGSTRLAARAMRKTQQQRTRRRPRRLTEDEASRLRGTAKVMLIHEHDDRTQIGVLEENLLIEHYVARKGGRTSMAGNVFLGKVQNVLPGMEAAFVDFGRGRNGVLYAGEVNYAAEDLEGEAPRIEKILKPGQSLMVQVTKDPIGTKGARLTTQVSLAGRYMVLAPDQPVTGISRRLAENERARLRQILRDIRPSNGHGLIVRTAAEGASKEALERDLNNLLKIWDGIQKNAKRSKPPSQLYAEPDLVSRVVRDIFSGDFEQIVCDTRGTYDEIRSYLEETGPDLLDKVSLHEGSLPLFETFRVTEQIHKALERKVWLPSGGSIVIDRTEAMTVIDVNTGKFTGKGSNLEETVYHNNLEAAEEVARQLRLRDIGGIIVIDFIDMIDPNHQKDVLRTLKRALSRDKTRSQVFEVSNLGLVEMTRKKVSEGLLEAFSEPCPNCEGRGIVITHEID